MPNQSVIFDYQEAMMSEATRNTKIDPNTGNSTQTESSAKSQVDIANRVQDGLGKASDHEEHEREEDGKS